jgi:hypothetical protein
MTEYAASRKQTVKQGRPGTGVYPDLEGQSSGPSTCMNGYAHEPAVHEKLLYGSKGLERVLHGPDPGSRPACCHDRYQSALCSGQIR